MIYEQKANIKHADGRAVGVRDLDSPEPGRFTTADQLGCGRLVQAFERTWVSPRSQ